MPLSGIIIEKIKAEGPLSFHDLMDMALYHPEHGFYSCGGHGKQFTGSDHPGAEWESLFGRMLGMQLEEMWNLLDRKPFTIIEYGSCLGTLCKPILDYLETVPELFEKLRYCIVSSRPGSLHPGKAALCGKAEWFDSIDQIPFEAGCILSNEALDRLPVHEVVMQQELMEIYIDYRDGFTEILRPASEPLNEYLEELQVQLPRGYRTEINLAAIRWLERNADVLKKGFLLTIDFGCHAAEFYSLSRYRGNLACQQEMQPAEALYNAIGERDIMAHVNFSALHHWGNRFGLECCGYTSQAHFLHSLGLVPALDQVCDKSPTKTSATRQLYQRIMRLSNRFRILVQQKGLHRPRLAGLQFAKAFV